MIQNTPLQIGTITFAMAAIIALGVGGCGSTGQKRQSSSSTEVVDSLVTQRSSGGLSSDPTLAVVGVTDMPTANVPHRTMQVGSASAFIHKYAAAKSKVIGQVSRGDAVTVTSEARYFVPPNSAAMDECNGKGNSKLLASWSHVNAQDGVKGWIPTRALIDPIFLATSSQERVKATVQQRGADGGDGMMGKNKPLVSCAKGIAGGATAATPNPTAAASVMQRAASAPRYDALPNDYFVFATFAPVPKVGGSLASVDPAAAEAAAAGSGALAGINLDSNSGVGGLMAMAGVSSDAATSAELVLKLVDICSKSRAPTPIEEEGLGLAILTATIGTSPILAVDAPVSIYVSNVGYRIAALSSNPYPASGLEFVVVDSPTPNAMAMPGGVVLVTTGLLKFLQSEDELAIILGHEVAHIEERHAMLGEDVGDIAPAMDLIMLGESELPKLIQSAMAKSDLSPQLKALIVEQGTMALCDWAKESMQDAANQAYEKAIAKPNTADECASDIRGTQLAIAAGYDPIALDLFLARISGLLGDYGGANYAETRPADAEKVRAVLPSVPLNGDAADRSARWTKLQGLLSGA